jgi:hypothetical protein
LLQVSALRGWVSKVFCKDANGKNFIQINTVTPETIPFEAAYAMT